MASLRSCNIVSYEENNPYHYKAADLCLWLKKFKTADNLNGIHKDPTLSIQPCSSFVTVLQKALIINF